MRKIIKAIVMMIVDLAVIAGAYILGRNTGYEEGWCDGELCGACSGACRDDEENSADIPDFENI